MNLGIAKILVSLLRVRGGKGFTQAQEVVSARIACPAPQPVNEKKNEETNEGGIGLGPTWGGEGEREEANLCSEDIEMLFKKSLFGQIQRDRKWNGC